MHNVLVVTTSCVAPCLGARTSLRVRVVSSWRAAIAANGGRFLEIKARDEYAHENADGRSDSKKEGRRELPGEIGWRGKEESGQHQGGEQVSHKHKNAIVNDGNADAG